MGKHIPGRLVISKLTNLLVELSFGNTGFVGFIADPDQDGSKTLALRINGAEKVRWSSAGWQRFYGTLGYVALTQTGNGLHFSNPGTNEIVSAGAMNYQGSWHNFYSAAAALLGTLDDVGLTVTGSTLKLTTARAPATAAAAGAAGEICRDTNYIYVCVGVNTWKRAALVTW